MHGSEEDPVQMWSLGVHRVTHMCPANRMMGASPDSFLPMESNCGGLICVMASRKSGR